MKARSATLFSLFLLCCGLLVSAACSDSEDKEGGEGGKIAAGGEGGAGAAAGAGGQGGEGAGGNGGLGGDGGILDPGSGGDGGSGGNGANAGGGGQGDGGGGTGGLGDPSASCQEQLDAFAACGGELEGAWILRSACIADDLDADCEGMVYSLDVSYPEGFSLSFYQGQVMMNFGTRAFVQQATFPLSCGEVWEGKTLTDCDELSGPETGECIGSSECNCKLEMTESVGTLEAPYTTSEGSLTIDGSLYHYCVQGDHLLLHAPSSVEDDGVFHLLERATE